MAYVSNETGRSEIHVSPFPGPGSSWRDLYGRRNRAEVAAGREGALLPRAPDGKLMAVGVKTGPPFEADVAKAALPGAAPGARVRQRQYGYDVSADGQRFLVSAEVGDETAAPLTLVLNWADEGMKR